MGFISRILDIDLASFLRGFFATPAPKLVAIRITSRVDDRRKRR